MKNSNDNQNDEIVEEMSFSDYFLELPIKIFLGIVVILWTFAMCIVLLYLKLSK
jgi:hypothetical protein